MCEKTQTYVANLDTEAGRAGVSAKAGRSGKTFTGNWVQIGSINILVKQLAKRWPEITQAAENSRFGRL